MLELEEDTVPFLESLPQRSRPAIDFMMYVIFFFFLDVENIINYVLVR